MKSDAAILIFNKKNPQPKSFLIKTVYINTDLGEIMSETKSRVHVYTNTHMHIYTQEKRVYKEGISLRWTSNFLSPWKYTQS